MDASDVGEKKSVNALFKGGDQHDAHELLRCFLEALGDEILHLEIKKRRKIAFQGHVYRIYIFFLLGQMDADRCVHSFPDFCCVFRFFVFFFFLFFLVSAEVREWETEDCLRWIDSMGRFLPPLFLKIIFPFIFFLASECSFLVILCIHGMDDHFVDLEHPERVRKAVEENGVDGSIVCRMVETWTTKEGKTLRKLFDLHPEDRRHLQRAAGHLFRVGIFFFFIIHPSPPFIPSFILHLIYPSVNSFIDHFISSFIHPSFE